MQIVQGLDSKQEQRQEQKHGYDAVKVYSKNFIGPSSCTLQIINIVPINENSNVPNIRNNYTVTDKADGDRHLMMISNVGKIYLINTNMKVIFTGATTTNKELFNSVLDGELIYHNKYGEFINLFAAFDIYFVKNEDVRSYGFCKPEPRNQEEREAKEKIAERTGKKQEPLRLAILKQFINLLNEGMSLSSPIRIVSKEFYIANAEENIFDMCAKILDKNSSQLFEYKTDGLIFTPANMGVGIDSIGKPSPSKKVTWEYSFKWKPPQYNTIDFLVTTKKTSSGTDIVTPIFQDGINTDSSVQLNEYKSIVLRVGYDSKVDGYLNPCQDVIDGIVPKLNLSEDTAASSSNQDYYPVQFFPTDPYDETAGICNIMLQRDTSNINQMYVQSEDNEFAEIFHDNTIVEFKYDSTKEPGWRWIPIKVRYDKTAELRNGSKNFGNAYRVANSNWKSIHNPVTAFMISSGLGIPDEFADDNMYYNKVSSSRTVGLRDFHNLFVKKLLITSVSKPGNTLIDYAVGKAGDLPKWISAKLDFVFGIDLNKDCLENKKDGACARYLNYRKSFKKMGRALFVNGNSAFNIKSGEAMLNDKAKQITHAVFGKGSKDEKRLGLGVFEQFGKGADGFDISSCQFAMHYFFQNETTFQKFMVNLAECTRLNGYFIGTCYDGNLLFKKMQLTDCINMYDNNTKICEIKKNYTADTFDNNISSLGYEIHVYQESIGKMYSEYLVNFDYLNRVMENYGFRLLTMEEAQSIGLPSSTGSFSDLYNIMIEELKQGKFKHNEYGNASNMTPYEKSISFLNKYFVYKKFSNQIDVASVSLELMEEMILTPNDTTRTKSPSSIKPKKPAFKIPKKDLVLPTAVNLHRTIRLLPDDEVVEEEKEEKNEEEKEEVVEVAEVAEVPVTALVTAPVEPIKKTRKPRTIKPKENKNKIEVELDIPIVEVVEEKEKEEEKEKDKEKEKEKDEEEKGDIGEENEKTEEESKITIQPIKKTRKPRTKKLVIAEDVTEPEIMVLKPTKKPRKEKK